MSKKPIDLSGLVATKGTAAPLAEMPPRTPERAAPVQAPAPAKASDAVPPKTSTKPKANAPASDEPDTANNVPLNFRVTADLRRRFRMHAAAHDLKLNELLRLAFDAYEQQARR